MKLIFSRKGFDSAAGGVANPILPDGRLLSLPIPDPHSPIRYGDLSFDGEPLTPLVSALTRNRLTADHGAHLDPDLDRQSLVRPRAWRPLFGQMGAAQGHLQNEGVGVGDVFLFFGWFKQTEYHEGVLRFVPKTPDLHVLFGWFQVDGILRLAEKKPRSNSWMAYHPHLYGERGKNNVLYTATKRLQWPGLKRVKPGAGLFGALDEKQVLTKAGGGRGLWRLPQWFHPEGRDQIMSYHRDPKRWRRFEDHVELDSVKRGQEYVLDLDAYPEANEWLADIWN